MTIHYHKGDLPDGLGFGAAVAIDTETMGLNPHRDRLCAVQLSAGDGHAHVVQIMAGQKKAPNLVRLLKDRNVVKIFHFARFDLAVLLHSFGVVTGPVYCTKIASRLTRTFTDRHGLKDLVKELTGTELSKQQQSSDWGATDFTESQLAYVLHLHELRAKLDVMLAREGRTEIAKSCFTFLPTRAKLDLLGWPEIDIFAHS
jgi:ribonuclease D